MFANLPSSPTNIPRPSNLHDHHPDMKPMNSSNSIASFSRRFALAGAIAAVGLTMPAAQATFGVYDMGVLPMGPTSKLNITNNAFIVRTTPYATVYAKTVSGYNGFAWDGVGIYSSNAAADAGNFKYTVGVVDNADPFAGFTSYFSHPLTGAETLGRFTYYGDADINGVVDGIDYFLIDNGSANALTGWTNGDFDYNGIVDGVDYFLIDNGFANQGPALPAPLVGSGKGSVVPEPGSIALLLLGALGLAGRRHARS